MASLRIPVLSVSLFGADGYGFRMLLVRALVITVSRPTG